MVLAIISLKLYPLLIFFLILIFNHFYYPFLFLIIHEAPHLTGNHLFSTLNLYPVDLHSALAVKVTTSQLLIQITDLC